MRVLGTGNAGAKPDCAVTAGLSRQRTSGTGCNRNAAARARTRGRDQTVCRAGGGRHMRFSIDVGCELELKLHQAILLYRNEQASRYMATVHGIVQSESAGAPILGAGQLITTAVLRELARTLGTACPVEFLPEQVVARTPELLAWWTPARIRPMFFRAGSELAVVSGQRFPHPALLCVVRNSLLYV